jgi:hypothetical protein
MFVYEYVQDMIQCHEILDYYFSVACRRQRNTMLYTANTITLGLLLTKHNVVGRLQSTTTVHIV